MSGKHGSQTEFGFSEVSLPEALLCERFRGIATITHLVEPRHAVVPHSQIEVSVSQRRRETLITPRGEDGIIVTSKKTHPPFDGACAILSTAYSPGKWIKHRELDAARQLLASSPADELRNTVRESWLQQFLFKREVPGEDGQQPEVKGLRTPQVGALHAIASHWTLSDDIATVVMPTGTGKTETMLSVLISERCECLLVVVPSRALRDQTAAKFSTFGVLKETGNVGHSARFPVVGILDKRPKSVADLGLFDRCNVIVAVVGCVAQGTAQPLMSAIADRCSHIVIDEAHHVAARTWKCLRDVFRGKPILQFTATPYREDRSTLDGQIIYDYPLHVAQKAGLFQTINFSNVFQTDQRAADNAIAKRAIRQLETDRKDGFDHVIMARCHSKKRAQEIFSLYEDLAPTLCPSLIFSGAKDNEQKIEDLRSGRSKIAVCVNMLAEGFDLPELKIAAMHDKFKSLGVTLQFVGRFTRVSPNAIGEASVIANTGDEEVATSLQRLYDENPDWNSLVAELSFERIEEEKRFLEFLQNSRPMGGAESPVDDDVSLITPQSIAPRFNAVVYRTSAFNPHGVRNGLETGHEFKRGWISESPNVAFFVTHFTEVPPWSKNRQINDSAWYIYALYYSEDKGLLFVNSSFSSRTNHRHLAEAVTHGKGVKIGEEQVFRVFGNVKHLLLQQVGLLRQGPRNLRYSMFTGADVKDAISSIFTSNAQKSNIFGSGFESGAPIGIGCSRKGKIWGRDAGPLESWTEWCDELGTKLLDDQIDVRSLIENALVPEAVPRIPDDKSILFIEWPDSLLRKWRDSIRLLDGATEYPFHRCRIAFRDFTAGRTGFDFEVIADDDASEVLTLALSPQMKYGFGVSHKSGAQFVIKQGKTSDTLSDYLLERPPFLYFTDQSQLEGNYLAESNHPVEEFPAEQLLVQPWDGVNLKRESWWKDGQTRDDSVQVWVMRMCVDEGFDIVFDDDGSNEIADVIAIREADDGVVLRLVHCKYSHSADPGARVADVVDVASQATKNIRWFWSFEQLKRRMLKREHERPDGRPSRFFHGTEARLVFLNRLSKVTGISQKEVIMAQPGVEKGSISSEMKSILGAAEAYVRTTIEKPLWLWCSEDRNRRN